MKIGCHVSIAGGLDKAPERAQNLGCECYQIFSRSPQGGISVGLTETIIKKFQIANQRSGFSDFYVHAPYFVNFGSISPKIRHNSGNIILNEMIRADKLGARFVVTHLGSAKGWDNPKSAQEKVIKILKEYLTKYNGKSQLLLENSAGAGEIIGKDFSQLGEIIQAVGTKKIAGICLDTQHSFASGWNWSVFKEFPEQLRKIEKDLRGAKICLIHINDSQTECGSKKDRHSHLGEGRIGLNGFLNWIGFAQENNIDLILETELDGVKKDIEIIKTTRQVFVKAEKND